MKKHHPFNRRFVLPKLRRYSLQELVAGITDENIHGEIDFGSPVGTLVGRRIK